MGSNHYHHEVTVMHMPTYVINARVLYKMETKCEAGDGDIITNYLPTILSNMICGLNIIICKVEVQSCHCTVKVKTFFTN